MSDRYALVSGLYGPGSIGCWLFTLASVVVCWTWNREYSRKDSIGNDLIATLALPAIAAGHLLLQLLQYPGDTAELMALPANEVEPYGAAIEASLNICETFCAVSVFLVCLQFALLKPNIVKRAGLVAAVGCWCAAVEVYMHFRVTAPKVSESAFVRPFLLNILVLDHVRDWGFIIGGTIHLSLSLIRFIKTRRNRPGGFYEGLNMVVVQGLSFPVAFMFVSTCLLPAGYFGATPVMREHGFGWRVGLFLPESEMSVLDLDQIAALCAGAVTFLFGLWEAWRSNEEGRREKRKELEERFELLAQGGRTRTME